MTAATQEQQLGRRHREAPGQAPRATGPWRIAIYHNLPSGGGKRVVYEATRQLVVRGHQIDLWYPETADERFLPVAPLAHRVYRLPLRLPQRPRGPKLPFRAVLALRRLLQALDVHGGRTAALLDSGGYDFVFAHDCRFTTAPGPLRHLRTPVAYFNGEPKRGLYEYVAPANRAGIPAWRCLYQDVGKVWQHALLRAFDRANARAATMILTNSDYTRERIWHAHGVFAHTSYLGADPQRFRPEGESDEGMVLSVGELVPRKGHDFVIEALSHIPAERRPRLLIAANGGWGSERERLRALAAERVVEIHIRENLDDAALLAAYNEAALLTYGAVMEPFGLVAVEALACGTPVVGVREAGIRESVIDGETGVLTPRDPAAFGAAVDRLLQDRSLRQRLGAAGRDDVLARWTWEAATDRFEAHFRRLLSRTPRAGVTA